MRKPKYIPTQDDVAKYLTLCPDGKVRYAGTRLAEVPLGKTITLHGGKMVTMEEAVAVLKGDPPPVKTPKKLTDAGYTAALCEALSYDALSGEITSTGKYKIKIAPWNGYVGVTGLGRFALGHRVAWLLHYGSWPEKGLCVDHINGDRADNRIENLRQATYKENFTNRKKPKNNTSGYKGVCKDGSKWRASICKDRKSYTLGTFNTPEEAYDAYCRAAAKLHGEFARTA